VSAATCARAPCWTNCCAWAWCNDSEAGFVLEGTGFAPRQGFEEMSWLFAANLHDHAAAAVANLQGEANFLEQAVFVDQIRPNQRRNCTGVGGGLAAGLRAQVMQQAQRALTPTPRCPPPSAPPRALWRVLLQRPRGMNP
jgi:hypothetical protein